MGGITQIQSFEHQAQRAVLPTIAGRLTLDREPGVKFLPRLPVVVGDYQPASSSGVSAPFAAPSATVGQRNTPDMRDGWSFGRSSDPRVNAALADNAMSMCGEYREHGRSVSSCSQSGSAGRMPLHERPVFIVRREAFFALSAQVKRSKPRTLPRGHEAHEAFSFKVNQHVSLPHGETLSRLFSHGREK